ncbi:MAG: T9SS type A sorting domain-containing protein [Chitinophagales bacterium]|nr:T9SS type A sorting domain-containing protein [Chitinophagales bacterium]
MAEGDYFNLTFDADEDDYDIGEYGVGVVNEKSLNSWYYYGFDYDAVDFIGILIIPKTTENEYNIIIDGFSRDIYGNDIINGDEYSPVIFGFGDGYYRDLFCYEHEYMEVILPIASSLFYHTQVKLTQILSTHFTTHIENFVSNQFVIELTDISGRIIKTENILSENQTFSFPDLPDGIYIATIKENNISVFSAKVILQK